MPRTYTKAQKWTAAERAYVRKNIRTVTYQEMANHLGRTLRSVQGFINRDRIASPRKVRPPEPLVSRLCAAAAVMAEVEPEDLRRRGRHSQVIAWARWNVIQILRVKGYSLPSIAAALGVDHTSIIHAVQHSNALGIRKPPRALGRAFRNEKRALVIPVAFSDGRPVRRHSVTGAPVERTPSAFAVSPERLMAGR